MDGLSSQVSFRSQETRIEQITLNECVRQTHNCMIEESSRSTDDAALTQVRHTRLRRQRYSWRSHTILIHDINVALTSLWKIVRNECVRAHAPSLHVNRYCPSGNGRRRRTTRQLTLISGNSKYQRLGWWVLAWIGEWCGATLLSAPFWSAITTERSV